MPFVGTYPLDTSDGAETYVGLSGGGLVKRYAARQPIIVSQPTPLTTSVPGLTINQTWNNAAVPFAGVAINITNTASEFQSKIVDIRVGGVPKAAVTLSGGIRSFGNYTDDANFEVSQLIGGATGTFVQASKAGTGVFRPIIFTTGAQNAWMVSADTAGSLPNWGHWVPLIDGYQDIGGIDRDANIAPGTFRPRDLYLARTAYIGHYAPSAAAATTVDSAALGTGTGTLTISDATNWPSRGYINVEAELMWYSSRSGNVLTIQYRGDTFGVGTPVVHADGVAIRPGIPISTSRPSINIAQIWNDAAVAFTTIETNITSIASAAGSRLVDLKVDGASKFQVFKSGAIFSAGDVYVGGNMTMRPPASVTPAVNLDVAFEGTSNTMLTAKKKGSDGTVRSAGIQLGGPLTGAVTVSTSAPSGGNDGDIWYQYT